MTLRGGNIPSRSLGNWHAILIAPFAFAGTLVYKFVGSGRCFCLYATPTDIIYDLYVLYTVSFNLGLALRL